MLLKKEFKISVGSLIGGIIYYAVSKIFGDQNPYYQSQLGILVAVISTIALLIINYSPLNNSICKL